MTEELVSRFKVEYENRGDVDLLYQVEFLSQLAHTYEKGDNWTSLLRAHALYISCAVRDTEHEDSWREKAYQIQCKFWKSELQSFSDYQKMTNDLKLQLEEIRAKRRQQTETIVDLFMSLNCDPDMLTCTENKEIYKTILGDIPALSISVNQDMVSFANYLVQQAISIYGTPMCKFCVAGMGSMAKGETTPYSDLEFLFLIERSSPDIIQYFERLAVTIYFFIGNLGETKLKYMAIPELMTWSDTKKEFIGHWFDDKATTNGFKMDGIGSWAGNIPTGGDDPEQHNQFICTVEDLAEKYRQVLDNPHPKKSVRGDFSAMLFSTIYVFGDHLLHDEFRTKIHSYPCTAERHDATMKMLANDATKFNFRPDEELTQTKHLKNDIYRYPSILILNLKILHGIEESDPWKVVMVLHSKGLISESTVECLTFSFCCALLIRLSAYFYHNSQDESISVLSSDPEDNLYKGAWYVRPELLIHMFIHLVPLKSTVAAVVCGRNPVTHTAIDVQLTRTVQLETVALVRYHCGDYGDVLDILKAAGYPDTYSDIQTLRYYIDSAIECHQYEDAERLLKERIQSEQYDQYDFHLLAVLNQAQNNFSNARDYFETRLAILLSEGSGPGHIYHALNNLGTVLSAQSLYNEALKMYERSLELSRAEISNKDHVETAKLLINIGNVHYAEGHYKRALDALNAGLGMLQKLCGKRDHADIASTFQNKGVVLQELGLNKDALTAHKECLAMRRRLFGNNDHLSIAMALNSVAGILIRLGDYKQALQMFRQSLAMRHTLLLNADTVDTAGVLLSIGVCLNKLNHYPEAVAALQDSLAMWQRIFPGEDHASIAFGLNTLGNVLLDLGQADAAMEMLMESLAMRRRIFGKGDHVEVAIVLNSIGIAFEKCGYHKEALLKHRETLAMRERIFSNKDHLDIATVLNNVALALKSLGLRNEALVYLRRCLAMRVRLLGNICHPDIAEVLLNIGAILDKQGLSKQALLTHRKCLAMSRRIYGDENHFHIAAIRNNIGGTLLALGRVRDALVEFEASLNMLINIFGDEGHPYVEMSRHNMRKVQRMLSSDSS